MLSPDKVWSQTFDAMPNEPTDPSAVDNFVDWMDKETTKKMEFKGMGGDIKFTFNKDVLKAQMLATLSNVKEDPPAALQFAEAWYKAVLVSKMFINAGAYTGAPTPATMWAAPPSVVVNKDMLQIAKLLLVAEILKAKPTEGSSEMPKGYRKAFLAVKYDISGINLIPPPGGPQPLVVPLAPTK